MNVVLPYCIKNEQKFFEYAFKIGFDEMSVHKFLFMFYQSDVDSFPKMGNDRLHSLIYGWVLCDEYIQTLGEDKWELPEEIEFMLKILVPWSLDIWLSKEWERCKVMLRHGLIHCLNKARGMLMRSPDMVQLNWDFLLLYNQTPWQVEYLKTLNVKKEKTLETGGQTIEMEEQSATNEDLKYIKLEQFPLIVLRLVKLFDQGSIDMVKTLCMRVLSAWNTSYHTELEAASPRLPYIPPEDKRCLLLICHIYLMAVYEADDVKGYIIDNMINNIRFYYQCIQTTNPSYAMDNLGYTSARIISLTAIHLRLQKRELFDFCIWNCAETSPVNLFGCVAQAYKSYLLGNLIMELNNMNEESFAENAALYKRLINAYVNEREKSELFLMGEMKKLEAQHFAHNITHAVVSITDFSSKICKGNRMSNIGNYENADDVCSSQRASANESKDDKETLTEEDAGGEEDDELIVKQTQNELSVDPIFQNIPNNEDILYYVYDVLSKKSYRGWQFAKIVLLFKIISHELNMLETWRYHPGLTTNFMLNLESKLSQHYVDLAKIFKDYPFMEQEFWLTAFYLHPSQQSYEAVKRLGIRSNRKRNEEPNKYSTAKDIIDTKFGLLSSTIDVKEIVILTNADDQNADYVPITEALHSLRLPDSVIKDILTVIFLPRNRSFSWAVDWHDLRRRCKMLMNNSSEKKRFVELTMAEANDRLKFLHIDYAKYKNRPQLDYGSIEQGYENLSGDIDAPSDDSDEAEDDFEDDEDAYESQKTTSKSHKKQEVVEEVEDDNSQDDDPYLVGKRRTRARTAAAMASLMTSSEMTTRRKRRLLEEEMRENEEKSTDNEDKSNDSKTTEAVVPPIPSITAVDEATTTSETPEIQKRNIKECLKEIPLIWNTTEGFRPLIDMWNIEKSELQTIDDSCVSLLESSRIYDRFSKLKSIHKLINPTCLKDEEQIDEVEMAIKYGTADTFECYSNLHTAKTEEIDLLRYIKSEAAKDSEKVDIKKETAEKTEENANKQNCSITRAVDLNLNTNPSTSKNIYGKIPENTYETSQCTKADQILSNEPRKTSEETDDGKDQTKDTVRTNILHAVPIKTEVDEEMIGKKIIDTEMQQSEEGTSGILDSIVIPENDSVTPSGCDGMSSLNTEATKNIISTYSAERETLNNASKKVDEGHKSAIGTDDVIQNREENTAVKDHESNFELSSDISVQFFNEELIKVTVITKPSISDNVPSEFKTNENVETNKNRKSLIPQDGNQDSDVVALNSPKVIASIADETLGNASEAKTKKFSEQNPDCEKNSSRVDPSVDSENDKQEVSKSSVGLGISDPGVNQGNYTNAENVHSVPSHSKDASNACCEVFKEYQTNSDKLFIEKSIEQKDEAEEKIVEDTETKLDNMPQVVAISKLEDNDLNLKSADGKLEEVKFDEDENNTLNQLELNKTFDDNEKSSFMSSLRLEDSISDVTTLNCVESNDEQVTQIKSENNSESGHAEEATSHKVVHGFQIRPLKVMLHRLKPSDLVILRQPTVLLKRCREMDVIAADAGLKKRRIRRKFFMDVEESSDSLWSNSSIASVYSRRTNKSKQSKRSNLQQNHSDSDCDSNKSFLQSTRKRHIGTPNSHSNHSNASTSRGSAGNSGCLVVTPRSASGLKLRISHADQKISSSKFKPVVEVDDIIQVSSSSHDESDTMDSILEVPEDEIDPLYEEAVIDLNSQR